MSVDKKDSRFLDKWKLVRAAAQDNKRLSTGDLSVLIALCDRYGSKYDIDAPALAGHALLGAMAGLSRRATIDSTRRLIDAGYIAVLELGSGTRGTKYSLNFTRGEAKVTTADETASGEAQFTTVVNHGAPLAPTSGEAHFTESPHTVCRLQAHIHVVDNKFEDAATPPPPSGLKANGAVPSSGDGFDEFWKIWPRKHGLKKAKAAWDKIAVETSVIIAAASVWAEHYQKHATDKKWIAEPANWLAGERWMEDLPIIHSDAKGAAISKAKANAPVKASNDDKPDIGIPTSEKPDFTVYPDQAAGGTIERVEDWTDPDDGSKSLTIYYQTHRGEEIEQVLVYHSDDAAEQDRGQRELRLLLEAVELESVDHAEELVGRKVDLMINSGKFISCSKPWVPAPKVARNFPRFADVVKNTPRSGWSLKIGTAPLDDGQEAA